MMKQGITTLCSAETSSKCTKVTIPIIHKSRHNSIIRMIKDDTLVLKNHRISWVWFRTSNSFYPVSDKVIWKYTKKSECSNDLTMVRLLYIKWLSVVWKGMSVSSNLFVSNVETLSLYGSTNYVIVIWFYLSRSKPLLANHLYKTNYLGKIILSWV